MKALFPTEAEMQSALGQIANVQPASITQRPPKPSEKGADESQECFDARYALSGIGKTPPTRSFSISATPSQKVSGYHALPDQWILDELPTSGDATKNAQAVGDLLGKCDWFERFDAGPGALAGWTMKVRQNHDFATSIVWVSNGDVLEMFGVAGDTAQQAQDSATKMAAIMVKRLDASAPKK